MLPDTADVLVLGAGTAGAASALACARAGRRVLVLDAQPGVQESAVIGVPHPDFGETVLGVLVPAPGQTIEGDAVMDAVRQALARFKHPRELVVVNELPRNTMGKVQKNILRDTYRDRFTNA